MILNNIFNHYRAAYSGIPKKIWLISLVVFVNRSGHMVLFFMMLYLTKELCFSVALAGELISIYGLGALIGAYLGGWLSDRIGPLRIQKISLILNGIGYILLDFFFTPFMIGLLLFGSAIVGEAFRPASTTVLAAHSPPDLRSRVFALGRLAVNLGVAIGPTAGGILALYDYSYLFWVDGLTCLLAAAVLFYFFPGTKRLTEKRQRLEAAPKLSPLKDHGFLFLLCIQLMISMAFFQLYNTWPLYMNQFYHLPENMIGYLFALNALLIITLEMPLIHKLGKVKPLRIMTPGSLFIFAGFAIIPLGHSFCYAAVTVMVWTVGEMLVFPLSTTFIANRAPDNIRGQYMGMHTFTFSLAFVVAPKVGTYVYQQLSPEHLWYGIGILGIFAFMALRILERREA
jgi:predicted MFS family arabinose efflux permease